MRCGDIVTVADGVYASKPPRALIVQDDRFDATDPLTVCPLTSTNVYAPLLRVSVTSDEVNGLDQDGFLMVDKMTTVPKEQRTHGHRKARGNDVDRVREATPRLPRVRRLNRPSRGM